MAQDIGDALGDWLVSLGEESFNQLADIYRKMIIDAGHNYYDDYLSNAQYFFNDFVGEFYNTYDPKEYQRKYDLPDTYSSNEDYEIVLRPDKLQEFRSGFDKEKIFEMIKGGIRFKYPRTKIPFTYISEATAFPGVDYVPVLHYRGVLQGAVDYWNNEVLELYDKGFNKKIDDLADELIRQHM